MVCGAADSPFRFLCRLFRDVPEVRYEPGPVSYTHLSKRRRSREFFHKVLAGTSGGIGGAFGLAALPIELPVSTTIILRSIADIARSEGHDLSLSLIHI